MCPTPVTTLGHPRTLGPSARTVGRSSERRVDFDGKVPSHTTFFCEDVGCWNNL